MKTFEILLVEDNEGDIILTTEALEEGKIEKKINVVKNGKDAIDYVFNEGKYEQAIRPDLILLDVNLPLKSGYEVLRAIKNNEETKQIPIIMLTTSSSEIDINTSYLNHANCFITKPVDLKDFYIAMAKIEQFWLNLVLLPSKN
jgi:CheY-like chemotaxis protein